MLHCLRRFLIAGLFLAGGLMTIAGPVQVKLLRVPDGGIQPQVITDTNGVIHLLYFKGDAAHGDLFYTKQTPEADDFAAPIQVNSQPGSALAIGSVRGGHLAIGKNGRAHVAWMGSSQAVPAKVKGEKVTPMLYTRLNEAGTAFEPERNVLRRAVGLDGGGSVAADPAGNVYVVWHAGIPGNKKGEAGRAVFAAVSKNDGKTFAAETQVSPPGTGACGCCGMRAFATDDGKAYFLYRAATEGTNRDMTLLIGGPKARKFQALVLNHWQQMVCPMSTSTLASTGGAILAAWEEQQQVGFSMVDAATKITRTITPSGFGKRKHPVLAQNKYGDILLAWTENTGWQKGGSFAWQAFDREGKPLGGLNEADGVPVWGLVAVAVKPSGEFTIVY